VVESRRRPAERAEQQQLPKRTPHQVGAADDFRDAQLSVVDHGGELIAGHIVFSPDEEIAEIPPRHRVLRAQVPVGPAITTLQGESFTVDSTLAITDRRGRRAAITATDVFTSNGVIHVLDRVILPAP
jgi:hypothetical protein